MKFAPVSSRRRLAARSFLALSALTTTAGALFAQSNFYWDTGVGAGLQGGAGTWSTAAANWNVQSGAASGNFAWSGTDNIANFSGTAGAVTVDETITLSQLRLTAGYSFAGTGALNFGAVEGVINNTSNISSFAIGLAGTNGIAKSGGSTFVFTGTGTYTGALTVSGGAFTLGNTSATTNRLNSASSLNIGSSAAAGTFTMAAATSATNAQTLANLGVGLGANTLNSTGASATNLATLDFTGAYSRSTAGVLNITNTTGFSVTANFTNHNDGTHIIDGVLVGVSRSNNTFVANNNTANGAPTGTNNVWSAGTHTVAAANNGTGYTGVTASVRMSGARTLTLADGAIINTGMIANNGGANAGLITGGTLTSGNGRDIILLGGDSAYRLEIASTIVDNGGTAIGLTVANAAGGNGNVISGNNTYSGDTTLASSLTIAAHDNAFGTGAIVFTGGNLAASTASNRTLANDIQLVVNGSLNGLSQSGAGLYGGVGATYDLTLGGDISGAGTLTLNNNIGANTVTLSGDNSAHTGQVIVNQVNTTLALASANAIGSGGLNLNAAGTVTSADTTARTINLVNYTAAGATFGKAGTGDLNVNFSGLGAIAYNINVSNDLTTITNAALATGAGASFTKNGEGTLAFSGDFSVFSGASAHGFNLNAGALQIGTGGTTGNLIVTGTVAAINGVNSGTKVIFNRSNALTVAAPLTGLLGVEQRGAGNTTLTGANTYTGATALTGGGTLTLGATGSIDNTSGLHLGTNSLAGTFDVTAKASYAFTSAQSVAGTGAINLGAGKTLTIGGAFAPGNSAGSITITGDLVLAGTASTVMEIAGSGGASGVDFDFVNVSGSMTYGGSLEISAYGGFNLGQNGVYDLFDFSSLNSAQTFASISVAGSFLTREDGALTARSWTGSDGQATYLFDEASGTFTVSVVPEPSVFAAFAGLGALAFAAGRRRRVSA